TRSAPSCDAARTPDRPTAPSPTTTTVLPGLTSALTAACHPVPITSESAGRLGTIAASGASGVAISVPSAFCTRISSAWQPSYPVPFRQLAYAPALHRTRALPLVRNPPTTKSPGFTVVTSSPPASTTPTYSCPIGVGFGTS